MKVPTFDMERWQSTYEHRVQFNLSESGVHPLTLAELLELTGLDPSAVRLGYSQSDGSDGLRERIAALFPGAHPDNVVATTGGAEANYVVLWHLLEPGEDVVVLEPTYGQTPGLARGLGANVRSVHLEEGRGWQPAPGAAREAIGPGTRMVIVTNPNNPTGSILDSAAMDELVEAAAAQGAWLVADEVYAGAETGEARAGSFWGRYDRVIVTGSLSKAYGLPGLRLGWMLAPVELREELWARKDYTTITPSALSDEAAAAVLEPGVRARVLERTRNIIHENLARLTHWLDQRPSMVYRPPDAGAICYVRYPGDENSTALAERLRVEQDVLIVPGDHFGTDGYMRLGFGNPSAELEAALDRVGEGIDALARA